MTSRRWQVLMNGLEKDFEQMGEIIERMKTLNERHDG
jgi:hypothetical protein